MGNCSTAMYAGRENDHRISTGLHFTGPSVTLDGSCKVLEAHASRCGTSTLPIQAVSWVQLHDSPQLEEAELRLEATSEVNALEILAFRGSCASLQLVGCGQSVLTIGAHDFANQSLRIAVVTRTRLEEANGRSARAHLRATYEMLPEAPARPPAPDPAVRAQLALLERHAVVEGVFVRGGATALLGVIVAHFVLNSRRASRGRRSKSCAPTRILRGFRQTVLCLMGMAACAVACVCAVFFHPSYTEALIVLHNVWLERLQAAAPWEPIVDVPLDWAVRMREAAGVIAAEYNEYVLERGQPAPRFRALDAERASFSRRAVWPLVVLRWYGGDSEVQADFPRTMALLRRLPSYSLAYFSTLLPGDRLEPHTGTSGAVLRYLLITHAPTEPRESGLTCCPRVPPPYDETAPGCAGRPGSRTTLYYRNASDILFDDMRLHMAFNNGNQTRVALFVDVRRPYAAQDRRWASAASAALANAVNWLFLSVVGYQPKVRATVRRVNAFHRRAPGFDDAEAPLRDHYHDGEYFADGDDDAFSPWS